MSKLRPIRVIKATNAVHEASVIFLHGAGDSGRALLQWVKDVVEDFSLPHAQFIFPTAPARPYKPFGGKMSNVWFQRYELNPEASEHLETLGDVKNDIKSLISQEVDGGIGLNKIVIGGFSMGGTLALHTGYNFMPGLGGVFALSSFLNNDSEVYRNLQGVETPIFMCHGDTDETVPLKWGQTTFDKLTKLGVNGEFIIFEDMEHELLENELRGLLKWILKVVPPKS